MSEPTEYLRFNLNYYLFVKLLPYGFELWEASYNKHLPARWRKPTAYFQSKVDADGYVKFQAWEFMQLFGPHIHLAMQPFQTDVLLRVSELHPVVPATPVPVSASGGAAELAARDEQVRQTLRGLYAEAEKRNEFFEGLGPDDIQAAATSLGLEKL